MTEQTLDRVARTLATGMPRRQALKVALGGAVAGTLGAHLRGDAVAARRRQERTCTTDCECGRSQRCVSGLCNGICGGGASYCKGGTWAGRCISNSDMHQLCPGSGCV